MTENLKWYESNFPKRLELCERYLSGMFDADKNKEPFLVSRDCPMVHYKPTMLWKLEFLT